MTATRRWCGRRFLVRHINEPLVTAATRASWAGAPWSVRWSRSIPFVMAGKAPARGLDFGDRDELLVIDIREVRANGASSAAFTYREMKRSQVFHEIQQHLAEAAAAHAAAAATPQSPEGSGSGAGAGGGGGANAWEPWYYASPFPIRHTPITYRDMRTIDPALDSSRKPAMVLRQGLLIMSLPPLRAILFSDRCLVFPEEGADGDLQDMLGKIQAWPARSVADATPGVAAVETPAPQAAAGAAAAGGAGTGATETAAGGGADSSSDGSGGGINADDVSLRVGLELPSHSLTASLLPQAAVGVAGAATTGASDGAASSTSIADAGAAAAAADGGAGGSSGSGGAEVSPRTLDVAAQSISTVSAPLLTGTAAGPLEVRHMMPPLRGSAHQQALMMMSADAADAAPVDDTSFVHAVLATMLTASEGLLSKQMAFLKSLEAAMTQMSKTGSASATATAVAGAGGATGIAGAAKIEKSSKRTSYEVQHENIQQAEAQVNEMIAQLEGIVRAVESFSDPDAAEVPARYLRPALGVHAQHTPPSAASLHQSHEAALLDSPFVVGGATAGAATGFTRTPQQPPLHGHAGPGVRGGLAHGTPGDATKPTPLAVAGMSGYSDSPSFDHHHLGGAGGADLKHDVSAALAAATAAAAAAAAAAASGPGGGTPGAARSEEMVDDFGMHIENTLSEARLVLGRVDAARKRLTLKMARARNETLKASMLIQLVTACMAACSMISGWFGMNLDNGSCGPEGCHDAAERDHGYTTFRLVTSISTGVAVLVGLLVWWRISRSV